MLYAGDSFSTTPVADLGYDIPATVFATGFEVLAQIGIPILIDYYCIIPTSDPSYVEATPSQNPNWSGGIAYNPDYTEISPSKANDWQDGSIT